MDCLIRPKRPTHEEDRAPYLAGEQYDGSDFFTYPARHGMPIVPPSEQSHLLTNSVNYSFRLEQISLQKQEQFVQTWLFFGLIAQALGVNSRSMTSIDSEGHSASDDQSRQEIVTQMYSQLIQGQGEERFVSTQNLLELLERARSQESSDFDSRRAHTLHMVSCLKFAWHALSVISAQINPVVRSSVATICDILTERLNFHLRELGSDQTQFPLAWGNSYMHPGIRARMQSNGWCPSDIARLEDKYKSLQSLHLMQFLDRSKPVRDHGKCTNMTCVAGQIDMPTYKVAHFAPDCDCELLPVKIKEVIEILYKDDKIPLLRLGGRGDDLTIDIVESGPGVDYISISHVWADGLGNPFENELHICQLRQVRDRVAAVFSQASSATDSHEHSVLVWIDTLCCPVRPLAAKTKAIEKIRNVYHNAEHVLVLDASLRIWNAQDLNVAEKLARIFTSGWMRRLWTLQEGALAKSLFFQFADGPVSLRDLVVEVFKLSQTDYRYAGLFRDIGQEHMRLEMFFHSNHWIPNLAELDRTLHYRSVTVLADEPLCIATMMKLDIKKTMEDDRVVLGEEGLTNDVLVNSLGLLQVRMKRIWEQLSEKFGGIPAQIIFLEEKKLDIKGWQWASQSFLPSYVGTFSPDTRIVQFSEKQHGRPTEIGLQVRWPGFSVTLEQYDDNRPLNPWIGMPRIAEAYIVVKGPQGEWYQLSARSEEWKFQHMTRKEKEDYDAEHPYPLHDLAYTPGCAVLLRKKVYGSDHDGASCVGIMCLVKNTIKGEQRQVPDSSTGSVFPIGRVGGEILSSITSIEQHFSNAMPQSQESTTGSHDVQNSSQSAKNTTVQQYGQPTLPLTKEELGLAVTKVTDIICLRLPPAQAQFYDIVHRIANRLRSHKLTDKLLELEVDSEQRKEVITGLKQLMKDEMKAALNANELVRDGLDMYFGDDMQDYVWVVIADWFNHGYVASPLPADQVWFVD